MWMSVVTTQNYYPKTSSFFKIHACILYAMYNVKKVLGQMIIYKLAIIHLAGMIKLLANELQVQSDLVKLIEVHVCRAMKCHNSLIL